MLNILLAFRDSSVILYYLKHHFIKAEIKSQGVLIICSRSHSYPTFFQKARSYAYKREIKTSYENLKSKLMSWKIFFSKSQRLRNLMVFFFPF